MEEHNLAEKKSVFGSKFFYLYMVFTRIPYCIKNNKQTTPGLFCALLDSNKFWTDNGIFIFTGFNKDNGMELFEKKRITSYRILALTLAMAHKPKGLNIKNSEAHLDKLMSSVFNFAMDELLDSDAGQLKDARLKAIRSIYRMVDLVKQMSCHTNSKGKNVLDDDNIAHVLDRPSYDSCTALGHNMDVRIAKHLVSTDIHRVFDKHYK